MRKAIEMGISAKGKTGDNPFVGALVVKDGVILGEGCTQAPGQAHAEVAAMQDCESKGHPVDGSTVYSTVEPCAFFGRTPSCALMLVEKRVKRVVIGIRDPHPRVNGKGVQILKYAGIQVDEAVCENEVREYLADWLVSHADR